jgi:hypothetical protein
MTADYQNAQAGIIAGQWVAFGERLRPAIRSGESQLRKFSARGFTAIIRLLDAARMVDP